MEREDKRLMNDIATGGAVEVFRLVEDGELTANDGIRAINQALAIMEKLYDTCNWIQISLYIVIIAIVMIGLYKFIRLFF